MQACWERIQCAKAVCDALSGTWRRGEFSGRLRLEGAKDGAVIAWRSGLNRPTQQAVMYVGVWA